MKLSQYLILRIESTMKHFPDIDDIKLLEKSSQKNGSGIVYEELLGIWKFKYVWGKESDVIKKYIQFDSPSIVGKIRIKK